MSNRKSSKLALVALAASVAIGAVHVPQPGRLTVGGTYTPIHVIGPTQSGTVGHYKALNGMLPGFSQGQTSAGGMKVAMDGLETLVGTSIESVGVGLPNSMSTPDLSYLNGETRFVVFAAPLIPHNDSTASITLLLGGTYDTKIQAIATALLNAGINGPRVCLRIGWEFNSGAGQSLQSGFEWATAHADPQTGNANGIANYKLGAAHYETVLRSVVVGGQTFTGWVEWNGGNGDTSALAIASAMPTHGTPANTLWGWDIYAGTPFNVGKNAPTTCFNTAMVTYDKYLTYCRANGYLMGHGEFGHGYTSYSPYSLNDDTVWLPLFYAKVAANADAVAYLNFYNQNQHVTNPPRSLAGWVTYTDLTILDEMHTVVFEGSITGSASTTVGTGQYPIGASTYDYGSQPTQATMGSQQHGSTTSATWVYSTDPNHAGVVSSYRQTFGGDGGLGAAGLQRTVAPVVDQTPAVRINTQRAMSLSYG